MSQPPKIRSDSFFAYPRVAGVGGVRNAGGATAGIVVGTPPDSPANNPTLPVIINGAEVTLKSTTLGVPLAPVQVNQPAGTTVGIKFVQIVNNGDGFIFVAQGVEMGIVPPFTMSSYTLPSSLGSPIQLAGWDGGNITLTDTVVPVLVLWSPHQFREDLSWNGATGGGGTSPVYALLDAADKPLVYQGFTGVDTYSGNTNVPTLVAGTYPVTGHAMQASGAIYVTVNYNTPPPSDVAIEATNGSTGDIASSNLWSTASVGGTIQIPLTFETVQVSTGTPVAYFVQVFIVTPLSVSARITSVTVSIPTLILTDLGFPP